MSPAWSNCNFWKPNSTKRASLGMENDGPDPRSPALCSAGANAFFIADVTP
jgi:hypothetical protein